MRGMVPFSLLDLAPVPEGATVRQALTNTLDLARHAEAWGYRRFWLAEHHNMPGIASAATAVMIGQVAAATKTIRVGAGGIMLPNHAPLTVAEAFGTLATLFPGRIDLGLGRAPGTDMATARALRRNLEAAAERGFLEVRIIHGRGIGVQREIVRKVLARSPHVVEFRDAEPGRGGWGATVATLRTPGAAR